MTHGFVMPNLYLYSHTGSLATVPYDWYQFEVTDDRGISHFKLVLVIGHCDIQIQSAVLLQYTLQRDRQADRPTDRQMG